MGKSRRSWTGEEQRALIDALKFSIIKGYRGENGFKYGHHPFLEEQMKKALPGITIVADPHIKSMVHIWKRHHMFLSGLLAKSGVNWNPIQKKVECTQELWDEECKAYLPMKNKIHHSWPFYEDWVEIFGKDRATGDNSVNFAQAVNEVLRNEDIDVVNLNNGAEFNNTDVHMPINEGFLPNNHPTEAETTCHSTSENGSTLAKKKRKVAGSASEDGFIEIVSGLVGKTDETLLQIVKSLEPVKDDDIGSLFAMLNEFPLTMGAKVAIGRYLAKNREERLFFCSLDHIARWEFLTQLNLDK